MFLLLKIFVLLSLYFFCSSLYAKEDIKIAMIAELSGANAQTGKNQLNGAMLAVNEVNKKGGVLGKKLQLEVLDNQSSNAGTVIALNKLLLNKDKYTALITTNRSTQILAIMPQLMKIGMPVFVGGTDSRLTKLGNPWVVRMRPHDGYSARVMVDFGLNDLKRKKWAIIYTTEAFGTSGKTQIVASLANKNIQPVLIQGVSMNAPSYSEIVNQLENVQPDILVTYIAGERNAANFALALKHINKRFAWVGSPSIASTIADEIAGNALDNSYVVSDFFIDANSQAQAFAKKYYAEYNQLPDYFSAWVYDSIYILSHVISDSKSLDGATLQAKILSLSGFKGVEGDFHFDAFGDGLHGYNVLQNIAGGFSFIRYVSLLNQK